MQLDLNDLFPGDISDEAAYHIVNFLMTLATELDSYYYHKIRRHWDNLEPLPPVNYQEDPDNTNPF